MDFALNEEQEMFRSVVRRYLNSIEQTQVARSFMQGERKSFEQAWQGLIDIGSTAITIPETYEGAGLSQIDLVPALEEIGRSLLPGVYPETVGFAVPLLREFGTHEQKNTYLPEIATGSKTFSLAWLEPDDIGFQPQNIQLNASEVNGEFVLNGVKTFIPDGDRADVLLVPARTGEDITIFLVDRENHSWEARNLESVDETRTLSEVTFTNVSISHENIIGTLHGGWNVLQYGLKYLHASLAAMMVGGIGSIVDMAAEYANTREQFGQPIGRFQAIKHQIVDMKTDYEMAKSLSYYANWALENDAADTTMAVAGARAFAAQAFVRAAEANIQIHGGIGFTTEVDCHLYLKRARSLENYTGSVEDDYQIIGKQLGEIG